ncbi:MAG: glycosyltransferase, partial [Candidatus Eremiobacterota bacterium]
MKRCLNIGIFTDVYKPVVNGVVTSIENLFNSLVKLNHKIYIFAPEYPGYTDENKNIYRFKSINLWSKVNYPLGLPYSRRIFKIINSLDLDLIHCHHPFLMGRLGQYIARKLNIPLVATLHTQYEEYLHYVPFNRYIVRSMTLWALRNFSNRCDTLIIPAESRKRQLEKYGISSRIKVIPNCIEPDIFNRSNGKKIKDTYSVSKEEKILIFVGRLAR